MRCFRPACRIGSLGTLYSLLCCGGALRDRFGAAGINGGSKMMNRVYPNRCLGDLSTQPTASTFNLQLTAYSLPYRCVHCV